MPDLEIDGIGTVEVDDGFLQLSPDDQNSFVQNVISQVSPQAKTESTNNQPTSFFDKAKTYGKAVFPVQAGMIQKAIDKAPQIEAGIAGAAQGRTFGFGDEIVSGISTPFIAGASKLAESLGYDTKGLADMTLKEIYQMEQAKTQKGLKQTQEEYPLTYAAGEIAGGLKSAGDVTKFAKGKKLAKNLKTGTNLQKAGKASALGAVGAGIYGAGTSEDEKLTAGLKSSIYGLSTGLAAFGFGKGIEKITKSKPVRYTAEQIKEKASNLYKKASEKGGILNPKFTNKMVNDIMETRSKPIAGKVLTSEDKIFNKALEDYVDLQNSPLSLEDVQRIDETLGRKITSYFKEGRLTDEGRKIFDLQTKIRGLVENVNPKDVVGGKRGFKYLKDARSLWSKQAKLRDIEKIISTADMSDNPATAIRSGFKTLYNNPKRMRGFSEAERNLIKKAAQTGVINDGLRVMSSRLIPIASLATSKSFTAPIAAQAAATASRGAAAKNQVKKAKNVIDEILNPSNLKRSSQQTKYPLLPLATSSTGDRNGS